MKYTKNQKRDLHKAFKAAESYLVGMGFLCWALESAYEAGMINESQQTLAKNLIEHRIHPHHTVGTWLNRSAGIPDKKITSKAMKAYRERWLASLIEEFSK